MTKIAEPCNPTSSEVREWAYTPGATEPCEDWDLSLSWIGHEREYLEFASDKNCPSRVFFLHVLYLMIGDAVRVNYRNVPEAVVRGFVELAKNIEDDQVRVWHERSLHLMKHPNEFNYDAWCGGGLARERSNSYEAPVR